MEADSTITPFCRTTGGRRGSTDLSLFCTSTCAIAESVPGLKVAVIFAWPEVSDADSKYSRFRTPDSSRSMRLSTLSFIVCGVAPG